MSELKKTPLNEVHKAAGAKMVDFGGWEMPVQYEGILVEHKAVREKAGLFDVSHMGEIWVEGSDSFKVVQKLVTTDISKLVPGKISYTLMCYPHGGVVDDLLVYMIDEESFLLVVNASNKDKDFEWIKKNAFGEVQITDKSSETGQVALQGPLSEEILQKITDIDLQDMRYYTWQRGLVGNIECIVSRTGYTGEDGFEIYCPAYETPKIWESIMEAGEGKIKPAGLGARDTLRFEACMPLYGHELSENITPLEAGLGFFVDLDDGDFIGREALMEMKEKGVPCKIVGFEMLERGIPRAGYPVFKGEEQIGHVTSGSFSPTLGKNIGLALIKAQHAIKGEEIEVSIRNKKLKALIVPKPFYKRIKKNKN